MRPDSSNFEIVFSPELSGSPGAHFTSQETIPQACAARIEDHSGKEQVQIRFEANKDCRGAWGFRRRRIIQELMIVEIEAQQNSRVAVLMSVADRGPSQMSKVCLAVDSGAGESARGPVGA